MQTLVAKRTRVWVCKSARASTNAGRLLVFFVAMIEGWTRLLVELIEIATAERISLSDHDLCRNYGVKTYACPVSNIYTFSVAQIRDDRSFECRMENVMRAPISYESFFYLLFLRIPIGNRPNESPHFALSNALEQQQQLQPQYKRQLPVDLTEEELIKEAAKVLAQSERIKCTADTPNTLAGIRLQEKLLDGKCVKVKRSWKHSRADHTKFDAKLSDRKFSSLPHRKKKSKPVNRSVSDASSKKLKRGSIFNLFSKRSDPTLNTSSSSGLTAASDKSPNNSGTVAVALDKRTGKPVGRSKSDVGYQREPNDPTAIGQQQPRGRSLTLDRKRNKIADNDESMTKPKKKSQLSPISENPPGERYFGSSADERALLRTTKSEEKPSLKSAIATNQPTTHPSIDHINHKLHDDLELMSDDMQTTTKRNPTVSSTSPPPPPRMQSQTMDSLHSSQLPQERLPLTKGMTVDGIVKRLSMERFSPPPSFTSPAFSYTRPPNESIVYAQVLRDENGEKATRPSHKAIIGDHGSPTHLPLKSGDTVDFAKNDYRRDSSPSHHIIHHHIHRHYDDNDKNEINNKYRRSPSRDSPEPHRIVKKDKPRNLSPLAMTPPQRYRMAASPTRNYSDEDEGIGFESRKRFLDEDMIPSRDTTRQSSAEPPIIPTFRPSYGGSIERINELANRRKFLESRIHERTIGTPRELNGDDTRQYSPQRLTFIAEPSPTMERYNRNIDDEFGTEQVPPIKTTSPPRKQWSKQPKYYPETNIDDEFFRDTDSVRREQQRLQHKQLIEREYRNGQTPYPNNNRVIDLGYIDQYQNSPINNNKINYKYPMMTRTTVDRRAAMKPRHHSVDDVDRYPNTNQNFSTLEREKQKYRSFDKGDSGIENDIKRERDHNHNYMRQRPHFAGDAMKTVTELFLKRERQHTELMHPSKKRYDFVFRERSIDDGSHFDPRLDKYPKQEQQRGRQTLARPSPDANKKSDKKFGSLKRVRGKFIRFNAIPFYWFIFFHSILSDERIVFVIIEKEVVGEGEGEGKNAFAEEPAQTDVRGISVRAARQQSEFTYELPFRQHSLTLSLPFQAIDISTRRRLSTPKASPLPKRNLSQKSSKMSHVSSYRSSDVSSPSPQQPPQPKTSWFKSLERLSRNKNKSSDAKPKPSAMVRRSNTTIDRSLSTPQQRTQSPSPVSRRPATNLRFFGDTDVESISKAATTNSRIRKPLHADHSQSAQNLTHNGSPIKSAHINGNASQPGILNKNFRSKYLQDLSESTSENENINGGHSTLTKQLASPQHQSTPNAKYKQQRRQYHSTEYLDEQKYRRDRDASVPYDQDTVDNASLHSSRFKEKPSTLSRSREKLSHRNALREQNGRASSETRHLPPTAPLKPAREFDRRRALSK